MGEIGRNKERGREMGGGGTLHIGTMHTEWEPVETTKSQSDPERLKILHLPDTE